MAVILSLGMIWTTANFYMIKPYPCFQVINHVTTEHFVNLTDELETEIKETLDWAKNQDDPDPKNEEIDMFSLSHRQSRERLSNTWIKTSHTQPQILLNLSQNSIAEIAAYAMKVTLACLKKRLSS